MKTPDHYLGRANAMLVRAAERQGDAANKNLPTGIRYAAAVQADEFRDLAGQFLLQAALRGIVK